MDCRVCLLGNISVMCFVCVSTRSCVCNCIVRCTLHIITAHYSNWLSTIIMLYFLIVVINNYRRLRKFNGTIYHFWFSPNLSLFFLIPISLLLSLSPFLSQVPKILREDDSDSDDADQELEDGPGGGGGEDKVVEKLRALIHVVEQCLQSNTGMQSTELTRASQSLLVTYDSKNSSAVHAQEKISVIGIFLNFH